MFGNKQKGKSCFHGGAKCRKPEKALQAEGQGARLKRGVTSRRRKTSRGRNKKKKNTEINVKDYDHAEIQWGKKYSGKLRPRLEGQIARHTNQMPAGKREKSSQLTNK